MSDIAAPSAPASTPAPAAPQGQEAPTLRPQGQPAQKPTQPGQPETTEQKAEEKRQRLLRAKFGDREMELDLENPEHFARVQREFQKSLAADQRLQEAAIMRREAEAMRSMLNDPAKVMDLWRQNGIDPDQIATQRIYERMQQEAMTPEQREIAQLRQQIQERERLAEQEKMTAEERQIEEYRTGYAQWLESNLTEALKAENLPKSAYWTKQAAFKLKAANDAGVEMSPREAVQAAKDEMGDTLREIIGAMDPAQILQILGEETGMKIGQHLATRAKAGRTQVPSQPITAPRNQSAPQSQKIPFHVWKEQQMGR